MNFDEDTLLELAGYPSVKAGRILHAAGGVLAASMSEGAGDAVAIKGQVQEARRRYTCGLVIRSAADADCHCSCPASRRDGRICPHALAVALACLRDATDGGQEQVGERRVTAEESPRDAIPVRIPLTVERDAEDPDRMAWLIRPELPGHRFNEGASGDLSLVTAHHETVPTRQADCPPGFQREIAAILRRCDRVERLQVTHNWLRINADHLHCMFHVECSDGLIDSLRLRPGEPALRLNVEGSMRRIEVTVAFDYPPHSLPNPHRETEALAGLAPVEFSLPQDAETAGRRIAVGSLRGEGAILAFYAGALDRTIVSEHWEVEIGERFAAVTAAVDRIRPQFSGSGAAAPGGDWFEFEVEFQSAADGSPIPEAEIRRLVATGQSSVRLPNGRTAALDTRRTAVLFESLENLESRQFGDRATRAVKGIQQFYAEEIIKDFTGIGATQEGGQLDLSGTEIRLRGYQEDGARWLKRRLDAGCGAVLADDMGLGKTVQALALVADRFARGATDPALVVAPTSLLATWVDETRRFVPQLPIRLLHGANRQQDMAALRGACLGITSFGTLVRDVERGMAERAFSLVIADEASQLRNPATRASKAIRSLRAAGRLALTGTPLENSLQDLWAVFEFAVPGYLGGRKAFLDRYQAGTDGSASLRTRVAPFLLRRLKGEVAADLPSKTEKIIYCDLTEAQRSAYREILRNKRKKCLDLLTSSEKQQGSTLEVLTTLLRLRQICGDLRLLPEPVPSLASSKQPAKHSCKLQALETLLERARSGGHRVLVFSQFVGMLDLVRQHLDGLGLEFCYLDGASTREQRAQQVERFQSAGEGAPPIFLISLKAGGYGLTLTAADTVIHLDPWWNPAVEAQATDRAHRIGQTRPVTSYKLIATGTVEEKILALQNRKRSTMGAVLDDVQPLMGELAAGELAELFE